MRGNGTTERHVSINLLSAWTGTCLDKQEKVGILTLGGCSLSLLDVVSLEIDTLRVQRSQTMPGRCLEQWAHHLGLADAC